MISAAIDFVCGYLSVTNVLASVMCLLTYALYNNASRPAGFPPGPRAWPLIGNIMLFSKDPIYEVARDLTKTYGDIFSIKIGNNWCVMLNNIDLARECFIKKGVAFAGRPQSFSAEYISQGYKDIALSNYGPTWKVHRKIGHSAIRDYASGENLEKLVHKVLPKLGAAIEESDGKPFECKEVLAVSVYNILATMCFGHEYPRGDPQLQQWIDFNQKAIEYFGNGLPADFLPFLKYFPDKKTKSALTLVDVYQDGLQKEVDAHRAAYDPENVKDLLDSLMKAQQDAIDEGSVKVDSLTDEHLMQTVSDLFSAGTDTTTTSLHWSVALMAKHPDIQAKVAEEIDNVVGHDRMPLLSDRGNLPYTEAAIGEMMRYGSVAPLGVTHTAIEDSTLAGYTIPKGTWIIANQWAIHNDEKYWAQPSKYRPEHFLDDTGEVRQHPNGFMPFSFGRRVCIGEAFAKAELFLIFAWLFQHYTFSPPSDLEGEFDIKIDPSSGFAHQPLDYKIVAKKRF